MIKICTLILASSLMCLPSIVQAETFSYTFISASYLITSSNIDDMSEDLEGHGIDLNFYLNISPNLSITGGYGTSSSNATSSGVSGINVDADIHATSIGILFHTPINQTTDFFAGIGIIKGNVDIKVNGALLPRKNADGESINAGLRAMVTDKVELYGALNRQNIEDESSNYIVFGASYYINKLFSLDVEYSFDSDANSVSFGATKYF